MKKWTFFCICLLFVSSLSAQAGIGAGNGGVNFKVCTEHKYSAVLRFAPWYFSYTGQNTSGFIYNAALTLRRELLRRERGMFYLGIMGGASGNGNTSAGTTTNSVNVLGGIPVGTEITPLASMQRLTVCLEGGLVMAYSTSGITDMISFNPLFNCEFTWYLSSRYKQ